MSVVEDLRGGLIVSCQARGDHPLRDAGTIGSLAACAERGGASGIRADAPGDIREIGHRVSIPIIGIYKVPLAGGRFFITPGFEHARQVVEAGASVVALEATRGNRPDDGELEALVRRVREELRVPVMADVSTLEEGVRAWECGVDLVATTLSGHTPESLGRAVPDLDLVGSLAAAGVRVVAEGGIRTPAEVVEAFGRGAHAVVVGTAITDPVEITARFVGGRPTEQVVSYLCVDGGQTRTAVRLLDEAGTMLESWETSSLSTPSKPGGIEELRRVVRGICEEAGGRLQRSSSPPPRAVCFSLTGFLQGEDEIPPLVDEEARKVFPATDAVRVVPDFVGGWAAATRGEPGIMVNAGGGAVAYGRNSSGNSLRVGGWGHLLGDEGSGYWIGLEAIKAALRSWAGISAKTGLQEAIMEKFRAKDDRELLRKVYSEAVSEAGISALVPLVVSLARDGDQVADAILDEAADHLSGLAATALERLGELPVYLAGGVFRARTMPERFGRSLAGRGCSAPISTVVPDPLDGVFLIAREGL